MSNRTTTRRAQQCSKLLSRAAAPTRSSNETRAAIRRAERINRRNQ